MGDMERQANRIRPAGQGHAGIAGSLSGSGRTEWFRRGAWIVEAIVIAGLISVGQWVLVWFPIFLILLIFVR